MSTNGEKRHLQRLADAGCILCWHLGNDTTPPEIHHLREGRGMSQRSSHFMAVPLCPEHHRGDSGLHGLGTREFERQYRLSELDLLELTLRRMLG